MKRISLTKGLVALVDDCDFNYLQQFSWSPFRGRGRQWYAHARVASNKYRHQKQRPNDAIATLHRGKYVLMHSIITERMGLICKETDHQNHNGLDNQRRNLRPATRQQNQANVTCYKNNTSSYKGVSWSKRSQKWRAYIMVKYKQHHLGLFTCKKTAARAYNVAASKYFGEFAYLNKV